jgi:uncharacterized membrane protein YtjA (UPF0391 family)
MLYLSIACFVVACLAAMFGYSVPADPEAAYVAEIVAVAALGTSILVFMVDRLWGGYSLRRQFRGLDPSRSQSQRPRGQGMVQSHHARAR